jgi:L-malate glycosyltransferase
LKVAHLVIAADLAGGQVVALELMRGARAAGWVVVAVTPGNGPFVERARAQQASVRSYVPGRALDAAAILRLSKLLREERPDLLHTHALFAGNLAARVAGRIAGVPIVAHAHVEDDWRRGPAGWVQQRLDALTARLCRRVVAVSGELREVLARRGYPEDRLIVIENGAAASPRPGTEEVAAVRRELGLAPGAPVVTSVARLCEVKGQRQLIEALALLPPETCLLLVGEDLEHGGSYLQLLRAEARRLEVGDRVVFAGRRTDVPLLLAASDVFALASALEGMPISVIEAMASARPVVATAVGGVPELVVDGETGILLPTRTPEALAGAIGGLLADPERARTLGAAGHCRFEAEFTSARMVARVLDLYREIAATP